jgi:hypothetical protein
MEEVEGNIVMGNGSTVQPVGMATFTLDFGNIKVPYSMVVADLEVPGVIGYDFLYSHGGLVDVQQGGHKLKCKLESRLPSLFRIILKENVTVPLRTESLTTGVVETKDKIGQCISATLESASAVVPQNQKSRTVDQLPEILRDLHMQSSTFLDAELKQKVHQTSLKQMKSSETEIGRAKIVIHEINPTPIKQPLCRQRHVKRQSSSSPRANAAIRVLKSHNVWLTDTRPKLQPKCRRPYITQKLTDMVYRIRKSNSKETVIHQSRMRPYLERIPDDDASRTSADSEDPDGADPDICLRAICPRVTAMTPLTPRTRYGCRVVPPSRYNNHGRF